MLAVLERGTALPATNSCLVTCTSKDHQTVILVQVYYGDYRQTESNTLVGEVRLTGVPAREYDEIDLKLRLTVDVKGQVTLQAREVSSKIKWEDHVFRQSIRA